MLVVVVALPALLDLVAGEVAWRGATLRSGGVAGYFIASRLQSRLGFVGALFLILSAVIVGSTLIVQSSLGELLQSWGRKLGELWQSFVLRRTRKTEHRDKERTRRRLVEKHLNVRVEPVRVEEKEGRGQFGIRRVEPLPAAALLRRKVPKAPKAKTPQKAMPFVPEEPIEQSPSLPPVNLLNQQEESNALDEDELVRLGETIRARCGEFGVEGTIEGISPGPVITVFEFQPAPGVKVSQIVNLQDDLALALRAESVRIDRMPGRSTLGHRGAEPATRGSSALGPLLADDALPQVAVGAHAWRSARRSHGEPYYADLATMPHLLVAGATGSGKSVGLQSMITSILYKATRDQVQFIFIDPKRIELGVYADIPHLKTEVVVEPKKAANALRWAVAEMERRYQLLAEVHVRSIDFYNRAIQDPEVQQATGAAREDEQATVAPGGPQAAALLRDRHRRAGRPDDGRRRPRSRPSIARLAQMARAVGIHLIVATQRPSVDILTGTIKANFPCRISFATASRHDSRTILDSVGAEKLLGKGDMLFMPPGSGAADAAARRLHQRAGDRGAGALAQEAGQAGARPRRCCEPPAEERGGGGGDGGSTTSCSTRPRAWWCAERQASASFLQRRMRIGFSRAARLIDMMERDGILGPPQGSKPREVLVKADYFEELGRDWRHRRYRSRRAGDARSRPDAERLRSDTMSGWGRCGESSSSARPTSRCPTLDALASSRFRPILVVSQPPRPAGRGRRTEDTAVARRARASRPRGVAAGEGERSGVPRRRSARSTSTSRWWSRSVRSSRGRCSRCRARAASTCTPRCCRAIAARRRSRPRSPPAIARPGVTTMRMEAGLDTGPILLQSSTAIGDEEDAPCARRAAGLDRRRAGGRDARAARGRRRWSSAAQDDDARHVAPRLDKRDALVDWTLAAAAMWRRAARLHALAGSALAVRRRAAQAASACGRSSATGDAERRPGNLSRSASTARSRCAAGGGTTLGLLQRAAPGPSRARRRRDFLRGERLEVGSASSSPTPPAGARVEDRDDEATRRTGQPAAVTARPAVADAGAQLARSGARARRRARSSARCSRARRSTPSSTPPARAATRATSVCCGSSCSAPCAGCAASITSWRSRSDRPLERIEPALLAPLRIGAYQLLFLDRVPSHAVVERGGRARAPGDPPRRRELRQRGAAAHRARRHGSTPGRSRSAIRCAGWRSSSVIPTSWSTAGGDASARSATRAPAGGQQPPEAAAPARLSRSRRPRAAGREPDRRRLRGGGFVAVAARASRCAADRRCAPRPIAAATSTCRTRRRRRPRCCRCRAPASACIDVAAAPGGKTFALAGDRAARRVRARRRRAASARRSCATTCAGCSARRRWSPPTRAVRHSPRRFDRVVVDVPCSGTGTLRKHPELKWRLTPARDRRASPRSRRR